KSIPINSISTAKIIAKSNGFIAGLEEFEILFRLLNVDITLKKEDGDQIQEGNIVAELYGKTKDILLGERLGLNLLSHMSTITTTTRKFVKIIDESGKNVKIACTRKTLPGLRLFEKKAVELGKGDTHRFNLDDMVLLKSTHLKFYNGNVAELLKNTKLKVSFTKKIEIEVEKVEDVITSVENGADIIMLDNMNPDKVQDAINLLKQKNLRNQVIIEVSGNITQDNIVDYLISEPDIISTSILTQKPTDFVDLSLQLD
ncbi:MAG: carboxylating nicotinate-nucleotide diphosphorylase, partial [Candidatus Thorarchaeota archaeon]